MDRIKNRPAHGSHTVCLTVYRRSPMSHIIMLSPMPAVGRSSHLSITCTSAHQTASEGTSAHQTASEGTSARTRERKRAQSAHAQVAAQHKSSCRRTKKHFKKTVCFRFVVYKTICNDFPCIRHNRYFNFATLHLKRLTRTHISISSGAGAPRPTQSASKTQTASDFF